MSKQYIITNAGIPIGFFTEKEDRDNAFKEFVLPHSDNCLIGRR